MVNPLLIYRGARILVVAVICFASDLNSGPDTECLVEQALARLPEQPCVFSISGRVPGRLRLRWLASAGLRNYRCRSYA